MAISSTLKTFLQQSGIPYTAKQHPVAYTAQEIAAAQHVSGKQLAKCVLVLTDRGPFLAVLPAVQLIDLAKLKALLRAKRVGIGREADIKKAFPDVEVGAMSAFGNLYHVPVVVEQALADAAQLVCNAGTHTETIALRYQDFARVAHPTVGTFGRPVVAPKPKKAKKPVKRTAKGANKPAKRAAAHKPTAARRGAMSRARQSRATRGGRSR